MRVLFSDLDRTLIHSHRHEISGEKIPAEYYKDRIQSYISVSNLNAVEIYCRENLFVPVTTRHMAQYERLSPFYEKLKFRYALICNGAVLLENNIPDKKWNDESVRLTEPYYDALKEIYEYFMTVHAKEHIHFIEPFFVYVKTDRPDETYNFLKDKYRGIDVYYNEYKVYCIPESISKGNCVKRFKEIYCKDMKDFAIGDSMFDFSMMKECSCAFAPADCDFYDGNIKRLDMPFDFSRIFEIMEDFR
ncbi:MAG TPA: hypothetical protein DCG30_03440 [Ruminococcus sp.]|nr:hypothetical protein [Ruminococcus sp.]